MAVVNISGSVWSSLHYDHSCCDGDQEGFLIGEVVYRETTNISDSQITRKTEEVDINITSHCPCQEPFSFYDGKGQVDQVKAMALLKSNYKNVVGFYRFRRNTLLQPSLWEIALYQRLLAKLPGGSQPETFLLGIFSSNSSWNLATHSYPYQLFTYGYNGFAARKVSIINLGDTAESEYKLSPVQSSVSSSTTCFQQILKTYSTWLVGQDSTLTGVQMIQSLSTDIHNKLQEVKQKVCDTECRLHKTSQEVYELRRRVQRQGHEREARQKTAGQALNTNNNAGLSRVECSTSHVIDAPAAVAMETNPTASLQVLRASTSHAVPPQNQQGSMLPQPTEAEPKQTHKHGSRDEPMEVKSSDPFAGLLKDMKQSISKSRPPSLDSSQKENSATAGNSISGVDKRTMDSREANGTYWGKSGLMSLSQEGLQGQSKVVTNVEVDDDETQIQGDDHQYHATLSPTF